MKPQWRIIGRDSAGQQVSMVVESDSPQRAAATATQNGIVEVQSLEVAGFNHGRRSEPPTEVISSTRLVDVERLAAFRFGFWAAIGAISVLMFSTVVAYTLVSLIGIALR